MTLLREQADKFRALLEGKLALGPLVDLICGYLPFPPEFKLQQMGTPNVTERAASTISHLERLMGEAPGKAFNPDDNPVPN
jgi:hypothetical protein